MARLAYVEEKERAARYLSRVGFRLIELADRGGSQGLAAEDAARVVVAFRGTERDDPTDLVTDAAFVLDEWRGTGRVHTGFAVGLDTLGDALLADVRGTSKRLLLTGHSLGAALATLAAGLWRAPRPAHLYTFGSPLVGDVDFTGGLAGVPHDRFVNCCDLATRVPPPLLGYVHAGRRRYIDRNGTLVDAVTDDDIERDRQAAARDYLWDFAGPRGSLAFTAGNVAVRELADHAPINYVAAVLGVRPV